MSPYYQSNIQIPDKSHHYTVEEAEALTKEQFDDLSLADQISLYNNHRHVYDLLAGHTADDTTVRQSTPKEDAQRFAEEFERRVDDAFIRVTGHKAGEIDRNLPK